MFRGFQAKDGRRPALAPVSIAVTGQHQYDPDRPEAEAYLERRAREGVLVDPKVWAGLLFARRP